MTQLRRLDEAQQSYKQALDLEPENGRAWFGLSVTLAALGQGNEAEVAAQTTMELGGNTADVRNALGESYRLQGDFAEAIRQYHFAREAEPEVLWSPWNLISAHLGLGDVPGALAYLSDALAANYNGTKERSVLVQSIHENLEALFCFAPPQAWDGFFDAYLEPIRESLGAAALAEALPQTVFALLRQHETISEERFQQVMAALRDKVAPYNDVSVAIRFLKAGVGHFKQGDAKRLLTLAREERHLFQRELGLPVD